MKTFMYHRYHITFVLMKSCITYCTLCNKSNEQNNTCARSIYKDMLEVWRCWGLGTSKCMFQCPPPMPPMTGIFAPVTLCNDKNAWTYGALMILMILKTGRECKWLRVHDGFMVKSNLLDALRSSVSKQSRKTRSGLLLASSFPFYCNWTNYLMGL